MKKIALNIIVLLFLFVLTGCGETDSILEDLSSADSEQEVLIDGLENDVDSIENDISDILETLEILIANDTAFDLALHEMDGDIEALENLYNQVLSDIEDLDSITDEVLVELAELKLLTVSPVAISQTGESLDGILSLTVPTFDLGLDYVYSGAHVVITHPLTAESGASDLVASFDLDNDELVYDLSLPYHGLYNFDVEYTYSNGNSSFTHNYSYEIAFTASHYNITSLNATMPVLLFSTDLFSGKYDNGYTYVDIERTRTFDFDKLPEMSLPLPQYASASLGNYNQSKVADYYEPFNAIGSHSGYAIDWINELYAIDNNSTFSLITVDNNVVALTSIYMTDIPETNFNVVVYTDGSYSTGLVNSSFSDMDDYTVVAESLESWKSQKLDGSDLTTYWDSKYILPATEQDNFEYIVNNVSSWTTDEDLTAQLTSNNITVLPVDTAFQNVIDADNLNDFEYLLKTRWGDSEEESMASYFNESDKKNLLILGTSPGAEASSNYANFYDYLEYVIDTFGSEYDIFYKGHPYYPSNEGRQQYFTDNGIAELESSIPVETLMLLYSDVYVGGYTSTSFQSSLEGQTLFFYGSVTVIDNNATLAAMINEGVIFANTLYLIPDEVDTVVAE